MAWRCAHCKDYVENGRTTCTSCGVPRGGMAIPTAAAEEAAGERDLKMEAHLAATALWHRVGALLAGALVLIGWLFGHADVGEGRWSAPVALAVCAAAYLLGAALGRRSNAARVIAGVFAVLGFAGTAIGSCSGVLHGERTSLIGIALSLAWSAAYVWVFWSQRSRRICSAGYQRLVAASPTVRPRVATSVFFWVPMIFFAIAVVMIVLVLGVAGLAALLGN